LIGIKPLALFNSGKLHRRRASHRSAHFYETGRKIRFIREQHPLITPEDTKHLKKDINKKLPGEKHISRYRGSSFPFMVHSLFKSSSNFL